MAKKDFADVIKLRILRWEDFPGLFGWVQCSYKTESESEIGRSTLLALKTLHRKGP